MQSKSQIETKVLYDRTKLVRIGSKINFTNRANPRKTTTSSNYPQAPEIVGLKDEEDSVIVGHLTYRED